MANSNVCIVKKSDFTHERQNRLAGCFISELGKVNWIRFQLFSKIFGDTLMKIFTRLINRFWGPIYLLAIVLLISPSAFAMDFTLRLNNILMQGEIRKGDYEKFRKFMLENFDAYVAKNRLVFLDSNGGDLVETLKIAGLLRAAYATVHIEYNNYKGQCASSCFFLYLSGTERTFVGGRLGIHRAFFDPSYFSGLSLTDAKSRQSELTKAVDAILRDNAVPQSLIDRMNRTSSTEIYWLEYSELEELGNHPSWYEEFLIAKCGYDKALMNKLAADTSTHERWRTIYFKKIKPCEERFVAPELKKLRILLQTSEPSVKPDKPAPSKPPIKSKH
jgi:hypothetical protein